MARRTVKKSPNEPTQETVQPYYLPSDAPWGGFINIRLDDDQRTEFYAWYEANAQYVEAALDDMLAAGIKVTVAYDSHNECFICSVTGALVGANKLARYTSTSRAGTRAEATALTVWKHYDLCAEDYGNYQPHNQQFMRWG